jgi:hypothetical protein
MTRVAPIVPAESDLLCEGCGYTLNGLPGDSKCPECGRPIDESAKSQRTPPAWELRGRSSLRSFLQTSADVVFRPTYFYRASTSRGDEHRAARFGQAHWLIASLLLGLAASVHASLFHPAGWMWAFDGVAGPVGAGLMSIVAYVGLGATTWAANKLTAWEAAYRGFRLPIGVVRRGMAYHAAHYLPVALIALATTTGSAMLRHTIPSFFYDNFTTYLYVLCGEVIVAAAYLFHTYWIAMRNMMYANR